MQIRCTGIPSHHKASRKETGFKQLRFFLEGLNPNQEKLNSNGSDYPGRLNIIEMSREGIPQAARKLIEGFPTVFTEDDPPFRQKGLESTIKL